MYLKINIVLIFTILTELCADSYNLYELTTVTPIEITAVGRVAKLGELYDARSDQFLHLSLIKSKLNNTFITLTQNRETKLKYTLLNTYEEKFSTLDISAELRLSILGGLFELEGSGRFFKDTKRSARSVKSSLIHSFLTEYEEISITGDSVRSLIDFDILEQIDATHVVVGIQWGGNIFISVEDTNYDHKDIQTIQGNMNAELKILGGLFDVSGGVNANISESERNKLNKFNFEIFGDILPDNVPHTLIDAVKLMKNTPSLLQNSNNGKGKAMKYSLIPISLLRKLWKINTIVNSVLKRVDKATVKNCVKLFDNINFMEQKINDLVTDVERMEDYIDTNKVDDVKNLQHNYGIYQAEVQKILSEHLILVRSGGETVGKLQDAILQSSKHPYAWDTIDLGKFDDIKEEISFIESLKKINVTILNKKTIMQSFLYDNFNDDLYIFIYNNRYTNSEDKAKTTFWDILKNKQEYGPKASFAAISCDNLNKSYQSSNTTCKQRVTLFRKGSVEVYDYVIGSEPEHATNPELWSLYHMQNLLSNNINNINSLTNSLDKLSNKIEDSQGSPVPIGFIYAQLPGQLEPTNLWPTVQWQDVSSEYAGLFFRVIGGGSDPFGETQCENSPRLIGVKYAISENDIKDYVHLQPGYWSSPLYTAGNNGKHDRSHRFLVSPGEVRPINKAMRIWKRIH